MPNIWLAVDSNLPDLSRVTDPKEQITLLFDYMVTLTEQLRYSLQNLSISNWNAAALNELKNTAGDDAIKAVEQLRTQLSQINAKLSSCSGQIKAVENVISQIEASQQAAQDDIRQLQEDTADHQVRLTDLETLINGENGIGQQLGSVQAQLDEMQQQLDDISENMQKTDTGVQIGAEGKDVRLVGNVYINGVLFEQGGETS